MVNVRHDTVLWVVVEEVKMSKFKDVFRKVYTKEVLDKVANVVDVAVATSEVKKYKSKDKVHPVLLGVRTVVGTLRSFLG